MHLKSKDERRLLLRLCAIYIYMLEITRGGLNFLRFDAFMYKAMNECPVEKVRAGERLGEMMRGDMFKRSPK